MSRKTARKNFLPTLAITLLVWVLVGGLIYFVDPESIGAVPIFFILIFIGLLLAFATLLTNSRQGLILAIATTIFLILRYFGVGNLLNLGLLIGVAITTELYFAKLRRG